MSGKKKALIGCGIAAALGLVTLLVLVAFLLGVVGGSSQGAKPVETPADTASQPPMEQSPPPGFALEDLKLTAVSLSGYWKEEDLIEDDEEKWIATACVVVKLETSLMLITNQHCLGLDTLFAADDDGQPEVKAYRLTVEFPNHQVRTVESIGVFQGNLDLAWLEIDATGLTEYQSLGVPSQIPSIAPGSEIVVVGTPMDESLQGTHTFGRVSALRSFDDSTGKEINYIQTDAALNHGNSGGPVFVKGGDRYLWAGVSMAKVDGADNLGLVIQATNLIGRDDERWFPANSEGVKSLFNSLKHE